ncbi:hypothetical protein HERIO_149 [Hepatospora eriocheir]|uniref:Uncharacterized protein n=1 Tax=Hepatospora eriocheir TaxID=1081669 RepID=A0A1X0QE36_9MICR|nr:hypothetical protein HERIO_149 [Hepatospora eriocheir]
MFRDYLLATLNLCIIGCEESSYVTSSKSDDILDVDDKSETLEVNQSDLMFIIDDKAKNGFIKGNFMIDWKNLDASLEKGYPLFDCDFELEILEEKYKIENMQNCRIFFNEDGSSKIKFLGNISLKLNDLVETFNVTADLNAELEKDYTITLSGTLKMESLKHEMIEESLDTAKTSESEKLKSIEQMILLLSELPDSINMTEKDLIENNSLLVGFDSLKSFLSFKKEDILPILQSLEEVDVLKLSEYDLELVKNYKENQDDSKDSVAHLFALFNVKSDYIVKSEELEN